MCLSLNNFNISGKAQIPCSLLYLQDDIEEAPVYDTSEFEYYVLGKFQIFSIFRFFRFFAFFNFFEGYTNGINNPQLVNFEDNGDKEIIDEKLKSTDFGIEKYLIKMQANPSIYQKFLKGLGIEQNKTLIPYSNNEFFSEAFSYTK